MKPLTFLISALAALPLTLSATTPKEQMVAAQKNAAEQKKDLLMIFSGSKWQKASQSFDETILKNEDFQKGIEKDFIKVTFDCPRERSEAHTDLLELQQDYRFREMPAVVLADLAGRPYAYTGMRDKEPAAYLKRLGDFHKIRVERDRLFGAAAKAKGMERAEILVKALQTLPQDMIRDFYSPELTLIADADPKGETGYVEKIQKEEALRQRKARFGMLLQNKKYEEVIKAAKAEGANLKGEDAQLLKLYEIQALAAQKKFAAAAKEVTTMKELAPDSALGKDSEQYLATLNRLKANEDRKKKAVKDSVKNAVKEAAQPTKPTKPIVSKPVAIVTDFGALKKEAKQAEVSLAEALAKEAALKKSATALAAKITGLEADLKQARETQKTEATALKTLSIEREKLARRSQAMRDVVENHEAMEKRKRDISELEKKAADLTKQAKELREKAKAIKKGQ